MSVEDYGQSAEGRPAEYAPPLASTPPPVPEAYRSEYTGTQPPQAWQAAPPQPQFWQAPPQAGGPGFVPEEERAPKRKGKWIMGLIALALVFTLLGGTLGGLITRGIYFSKMQQNQISSKASGTEKTPAGVGETERGSAALVPKETQRAGEAAPAAGLATPDIVEMAAPATVAIYADKTARNMFGDMKYIGSGSGVLISPDGYIVTNNHVVGDSTHLKVTLSDGSEYSAKLVGSNEIVDIAVIKIEVTRELPYIKYGSSEQLRVGETVIAIGNPLGELQGTVSQGIVSALHRNVTIENQPMEDLIQIDAAINSGNSGGALLNAQGKLVGINVAKSMGGLGDSVEGIAFAIPADKVKLAAEEIMQGHSTLRPMVGISAQNIDPEQAKAKNIPEGVLVLSVVSGSSAEKAGLQEGDVITEVEGKAVSSIAELNLIKNKMRVGDTMEITISRAGQTLSFSLKLASTAN